MHLIAPIEDPLIIEQEECLSGAQDRERLLRPRTLSIVGIQEKEIANEEVLQKAKQKAS